MQIVILQDVIASYATTWIKIANTQGVKELKHGQVFRLDGTGEGGEELSVDTVSLSDVPGVSRVLFLRGHNLVPPQTYRLGSVLNLLVAPEPEPALVSSIDDFLDAPIKVKREESVPELEPVPTKAKRARAG